MTNAQKRSQDKQSNAFDFSCCSDWSRMKPDQMKKYDCARLMSQMMERCSCVEAEVTTPQETDTPDTII